MQVAPVVELSEKHKVELSQRARIVLLAVQGLQNKDIAEQLGVGRVQVSRWRRRYVEFGLEGIEHDLARGAPPVKVAVAKLAELTTQSTPQAATHWSTRKMAAVLQVSPSTARLICSASSRHWGPMVSKRWERKPSTASKSQGEQGQVALDDDVAVGDAPSRGLHGVLRVDHRGQIDALVQASDQGQTTWLLKS